MTTRVRVEVLETSSLSQCARHAIVITHSTPS
jgi:hypothetical protein